MGGTWVGRDFLHVGQVKRFGVFEPIFMVDKTILGILSPEKVLGGLAFF